MMLKAVDLRAGMVVRTANQIMRITRVEPQGSHVYINYEHSYGWGRNRFDRGDLFEEVEREPLPDWLVAGSNAIKQEISKYEP